uniref:SAP domain-containing protein n=1 Tax=Odontella aurita TaxID=265563 RepID=A0A7S4MUQ3_9STRA
MVSNKSNAAEVSSDAEETGASMETKKLQEEVAKEISIAREHLLVEVEGAANTRADNEGESQTAYGKTRDKPIAVAVEAEPHAVDNGVETAHETSKTSKFSAMKVSELREKCASIGLETRGTKKDDMIFKLESHFSSNAAEEQSSAPHVPVQVFSKMKVVDLRKELRKVGLETNGIKRDLIARLEEHYSV